MKTLIDYSNYILKDNNQIDVIFYKDDDGLVVEATCTREQCKYRGIRTFETVPQAREYFNQLIDQIAVDENVDSFGIIDNQWYNKWDWIRIDSHNRPLTHHLETTEFDCGNVRYKFRFDSKGNVDPKTVVIDQRFLIDSVGVPLITELASLKYNYQLKGYIDKLFLNRQISKIYKLLDGHIRRAVKVGSKIIGSKPMKDIDIIANGIVNDILTYESLEVMFITTSVLINPNFSVKIH